MTADPFTNMSEEDEIVDPKKILFHEEEKKGTCGAQLKLYNACAQRIKNDTTGQKHCTGWYFDYLECMDHHVCVGI